MSQPAIRTHALTAANKADVSVDTVHTLFGRTNRTVVSSPAPRKYYFQAFSNKAGQVMLLPSAHDHEQVLDNHAQPDSTRTRYRIKPSHSPRT